ncbi:MAG: AraC family transcriptional regulator ligand-binding domain-containing protein [Planctomycetota bacterium]
MGQITSLFVHKILQNVADSIDKSLLLNKLGLGCDGSVDPKRMIADDDYYAFLESIASLDPNAIDLPLRTGQSMRCDEYGAFGLAWKSASNLLGSFERAVRYARVLTNVSTYEVEVVDDGAWMILNRDGQRRLGMRLSNEATIASIFAISNEACSQPVVPLEVRLKHRQPETICPHESHFGCTVNFGADRDGILFPKESITVVNRLADIGIVSYLDNQLEKEVGQFVDDMSFDREVCREIANKLSNGIPTVTSIAKAMGMSARTMQRRLSDSGFTFRKLVDEARRQLAEGLLADSDYSIVEIAFLAGFSEQSAFNRAFKRWSGQTPRSFRLNSIQ